MRVHEIARALTLSVAVAVIGLIAAAPASAALGGGQTVRVKSKVTVYQVDGGFPDYNGRVKANEAACTENRKVKLFFKPTSGGPRRLLRTTSTGDYVREHPWGDFSSFWGPKWIDRLSRNGSLSADYLVALVTRTERSGYVCLRDRSRRLPLDRPWRAGATP
jgi:hypothetical protein